MKSIFPEHIESLLREWEDQVVEDNQRVVCQIGEHHFGIRGGCVAVVVSIDKSE